MRYPPTDRQDTVENLHGEQVADPYRWLEDTDAPATRAWIDAQNALTRAWLADCPGREAIRERLTALWDYPKYGAPFERGGQFFQWRQLGLANQPVLYAMDGPDAEGSPLLDPNGFSAEGTAAVTSLAPSHDGTLIAYFTASSGSDWGSWRVRRVATGADLDEKIDWAKFAEASWTADASGFYYGAPDPPEPGREFLAETRHQRVRFHALGTPPAADPVVFECPDEPEFLPHAQVSEDGRWLIVAIHQGTRRENQLHALDLTDPAAGWQPVAGDFVSANTPITTEGETLYLVTDRDAERHRVVAVSMADPDPAHWREVIPETADRLLEVHHCGTTLVCHYLHDGRSRLAVHALHGTAIRQIDLPEHVTVFELAGRPGSTDVYFKLTSFTDSGSIWHHDLATGATTALRASEAAVDPAEFHTEQVFATSADGTAIPMFLTRRRDARPTGDAPTLLYGYGGFDIPMTPGFSVERAVWLERGGLLAVANLRGGGEYGRAWHDAGRLANKQNVFDDFAACAGYLAGSGWTRADRIVINGRSNGGLLVGAALTQHPELYGAAIPEVGVLDMLRFHKFTIGWAWTSDYGDPDEREHFRWLVGYSPLHNVTPGACYPPTLVVTGDHDDRVVPGHSFKFAATLQAAQGCEHPVLIRVETAAGHGMGKPTAKIIAERTDVLAFAERALGRPGT